LRRPRRRHDVAPDRTRRLDREAAGTAWRVDPESRLPRPPREVVHAALERTEPQVVTPANREQMLRILRENIMRGHFPAALPEHPPSLHYSDERNAWSTSTDIDTLVKKFRKELDTLAGFTYVVDSLDEAAAQIA